MQLAAIPDGEKRLRGFRAIRYARDEEAFRNPEDETQGEQWLEMREHMLEDSLVVPFGTEILGVEVPVERVDMNDDEQIVAVCTRRQSRQRVPILDLPLPDPPPGGAEWIDAFRRWARGR